MDQLGDSLATLIIIRDDLLSIQDDVDYALSIAQNENISDLNELNSTVENIMNTLSNVNDNLNTVHYQ
ncbi:MAG: hypothetical protein ACTSPI_08495 [Candidatus Heimdallarchaeaceae archaeon]